MIVMVAARRDEWGREAPLAPTAIFRVFVSSTFADMRGERNALQKWAFPRLAEYCARYRCHFQAIDLRWGVTREAGLDQKTIDICLEELRRCQESGLRPSFIALLGDRYGTRLLPPRIPADEFDALLRHVCEPDRRFLVARDGDGPATCVDARARPGWYRRDDNADPAEYVLLSRALDVDPGTADRGLLAEAERREQTAWDEAKARLTAILQRAMDACGWNIDGRHRCRYLYSATHQEICVGALEVDDDRGHAHAFLRNDTGSESADPDAVRLRALKRELKERLGGRAFEYDADWSRPGLDDSARRRAYLAYLRKLADDVFTSLSRTIERQLDALTRQSPLDHERAAHDRFGADVGAHFHGREDLLSAVDAYLQGRHPDLRPHAPLVLHGRPGCGKSAVAAELVRRLTGRGFERVIVRYVEATTGSGDLPALVASLCADLAVRASPEAAPVTADRSNPVRQLERQLQRLPADRPTVIVVDGVERITDNSDAVPWSLSWIPSRLPPNVRLIVTVADDWPDGDLSLRALLGRIPPGNNLELRALTAEEGEAILRRWLAAAGRTLGDAQRTAVLERFAEQRNARYLRVLFDIASQWRSFDHPGHLTGSLRSTIGNLLDDLERPQQHGAVLVGRALSYLCATRHGLPEDELLDLLSRDEAVMRDFRARSPRSPRSRGLPVIFWLRLRRDLRPLLAERSPAAEGLVHFDHLEAARAVNDRYLSRPYFRFSEVASFQRAARQAGVRVQHRVGFTDPVFRRLAEYYLDRADPAADRSWRGGSARAFGELIYQQLLAGMNRELTRTLLDYRFLDAALRHLGPLTLSDCLDVPRLFDVGADDPTRTLALMLRSILRRASAVLSRDPAQFPAQLAGWLTGARHPLVAGLLAQCVAAEKRPWLRPLTGSLTQPGGLLMATLPPVPGGGPATAEAIALPRDGGTMIFAYGSTIVVREVASGEAVFEFEGHEDVVSSLLCTADGLSVISASWDGAIILWSLADGSPTRTIGRVPEGVADLAISQDERILVSLCWDRTIRIWGIDDGSCEVIRIDTPNLEPAQLQALAVTPDGGRALITSVDGGLELWDLRARHRVASLAPAAGQVAHLAASPDGGLVASGATDGVIGVWRTSDGTCALTIDHFGGDPVLGLAFLAGGRVLASAHKGAVALWTVDGGDAISAIVAHDRDISALCAGPYGDVLATASKDGTATVWDVSNVGLGLVNNPVDAFTTIAAVTRLGGSEAFAAVSDDGEITTWDWADGRRAAPLRTDSRPVRACASLPGGCLVAIGRDDGVVDVWDLRRRILTRRLPGEREPIAALAALDERRLLAIDEYTTSLRVLDVPTGRCEHVIRSVAWTGGGRLHALATADDGNLAVVVAVKPVVHYGETERSAILVCDTRNGRVVHALVGHTGRPYAVAFTPDQTQVVSAADDGNIRIWSLLDGTCVRTIDKGPGRVSDASALVVTPDGRTIVASTDDRNLGVWSFDTGERIGVLSGHSEPVHGVALSPDGGVLLSLGGDGFAILWALDGLRRIATLDTNRDLQDGVFDPTGQTVMVRGRAGFHLLRLQNIPPRPPGRA